MEIEDFLPKYPNINKKGVKFSIHMMRIFMNLFIKRRNFMRID